MPFFLYLCTQIKHKHMKKSIVFVLIAMIVSACSGGNDRILMKMFNLFYFI